MNKILKHIPSLVFIGVPGLSRLILFYLLSIRLPTDEFANFSASYSVSLMFSMVGGIGCGMLIIKDEIKLNLYRLFYLSAFGTIFSLPILLFNWTKINSDIISVVLFGFSLVVNQLLRHVLILKQKLSIGALYELCILIIALAIPYLIGYGFLLLALSINYMFISLLFTVISNRKAMSTYVVHLNLKEAIYIGYSNLLSTGILFFFPVFSLQLTNSEISKVLGLVVSSIGIVSVFPRAILTNKIKELKVFYTDNNFYKYICEVKKFRRKVTIIMFLSLFLVLIYGYFIKTTLPYESVVIVIISIFSFLFVGQVSIPETTMCNMIGEGRFSFYWNLIVFTIFIGFYYFLSLFKFDGDIFNLVLMSVVVFILYFVRMFFMNKKINSFGGKNVVCHNKL